MLELLTRPDVWAAFVTLSVMEIVLGIDNIIFISILVGKLPEPAATRARQIGLLLALVFRILLLFAITWIIGLVAPVFTLPFDLPGAGRPRGLRSGDFLARHDPDRRRALPARQGHARDPWRDRARGEERTAPRAESFAAIIVQIVLIDMVFSVNSILTAVGMVDDVEVMIAAVIVAIGIMYVASGPIADFVKRNPTTKMLALAFLLLIGVALDRRRARIPHSARLHLLLRWPSRRSWRVFNVLARRGRRKTS